MRAGDVRCGEVYPGGVQEWVYMDRSRKARAGQRQGEYRRGRRAPLIIDFSGFRTSPGFRTGTSVRARQYGRNGRNGRNGKKRLETSETARNVRKAYENSINKAVGRRPEAVLQAEAGRRPYPAG